MDNSFLSILSRHQIVLTLAIFVVFIASGAFFYGQFGKQTATVAEGKCSSQYEIDEQKAKLEDLKSQASVLQAEIAKAESNIVARSSSETTAKMRIEDLKTEIQSDYAVSLENENVNRLCPDDGTEPPECVSAKKSYNNLVKDNEAKKKELKALEAGESNLDGPADLSSKNKEDLKAINTQITDLTEAITVIETNICPEETK